MLDRRGHEGQILHARNLRRRELALRLLALAEDRMEQIQLAVDEGLLAKINVTENERLIVDRRTWPAHEGWRCRRHRSKTEEKLKFGVCLRLRLFAVEQQVPQ